MHGEGSLSMEGGAGARAGNYRGGNRYTILYCALPRTEPTDFRCVFGGIYDTAVGWNFGEVAAFLYRRAPRGDTNEGTFIKQNLMRVFTVFKQVFSSAFSTFFAVAVFIFLFFLVNFLPNRALVLFVLRSDGFDWERKIKFFFSTLTWFFYNNTPFVQVLLIAVMLLAGINLAMSVFFLRKRYNVQRQMGVSLLGVFLGFFSVGCASCGSVILTSVFGVGVTTGVLAILPFRGIEFAALSLILLVLSLVFLVKKLQEPMVCVQRKLPFS